MNVNEVRRRYRAGEAPIQIADNLGLGHDEVLNVLGLYVTVYGQIKPKKKPPEITGGFPRPCSCHDKY